MAVALPQGPVTRQAGPTVEITRRLLDYLLSGQLTPGQKIPSERQLAEGLAVGRGALREAIKSLSLLGLLEQRIGDGTYLSRSSSDLLPQVIEWGLLLGEKRLDDLLEARYHLEVLLSGWAAQRRTEEQLARLRELVAEMHAAGSADLDSYVRADIAFHLQVAACSGNTVLADVLDQYPVAPAGLGFSRDPRRGRDPHLPRHAPANPGCSREWRSRSRPPSDDPAHGSRNPPADARACPQPADQVQPPG